jgi:hypothetical protein
MKLRIQNNSVRLRLTQKEVVSLRDRRLVECAIRFPAGRKLGYSVASSSDATEISVAWKDGSICVTLPHVTVNEWAGSGEITIEGSDSGVQILVEKDFQGLHKPAERDPDSYPHPLAGTTTTTGG